MRDSVTGNPVTESHVCQGHLSWVKLISNEHTLLLVCYGLK